MTTLQQLTNCYILRNHAIIKEDLWIRDGIICNPEKLFYDEKIQADVRWDCRGVIVAPGFIDVQINGGFGVDFSNMSRDVNANVTHVAKGLLQHGVTSFCPTLVSSPSDTYHRILPHLKRKNGDKDGASILGVHLEGPFINPAKKGAHPDCCLRQYPNGFQDVIDMYGYLDDIAIVTLTPEFDKAKEVIGELCSRGIVVSLGHSEANLEQGEEAVREGASFITHLFNAMLPFHHRDPHLVGLLTSTKLNGNPVFYGLITDNVHTHPAAMRIAHRVHPNGLILVTDAIQAMGMEQGRHILGGQTVYVSHDRVVLVGTDTLAGSIATMDECVRKFYKGTGCTQVAALEAASLHPAQLLNITHTKGTLQYGTDAFYWLYLMPSYPYVVTDAFLPTCLPQCLPTGCTQVAALEAASLHPAQLLNITHTKGTLQYGTDADLVMLDCNLKVKATWIAGEVVWRSVDCDLTVR